LLTRYFPASPVQNSTAPGSTRPNGGCESYVELAKALNTLGEPRSLSCNAANWALNPGSTSFADGTHGIFLDGDYDFGLVGFKASGAPVFIKKSLSQSSISGDLASGCFAMAIDLETSNGLEISGLNAEEQSDISFLARFSAAQQTGFSYEVFTHIDSMIVLKENNVFLLLTLGSGAYSIKVNCMIYNKNGCTRSSF